jgi:hypothetical protein
MDGSSLSGLVIEAAPSFATRHSLATDVSAEVLMTTLYCQYVAGMTPAIATCNRAPLNDGSPQQVTVPSPLHSHQWMTPPMVGHYEMFSARLGLGTSRAQSPHL